MTTLNTKQPICLPSLRILSDYWTLRVIDELSDGGALRFSEIERRLGRVNTATLTKRLREMRESGLVTRTETSRADVAYSLTDLGIEALPLLDAVNHFSACLERRSKLPSCNAVMLE